MPPPPSTYAASAPSDAAASTASSTPAAWCADGVEEAVDAAASLGADAAYVLGGGGIYELFQPHVDRMVLSRVPGEYEGDSTYPEWDREEWELTDSTEYDRFTLEEWRRA